MSPAQATNQALVSIRSARDLMAERPANIAAADEELQTATEMLQEVLSNEKQSMESRVPHRT